MLAFPKPFVHYFLAALASSDADMEVCMRNKC